MENLVEAIGKRLFAIRKRDPMAQIPVPGYPDWFIWEGMRSHYTLSKAARTIVVGGGPEQWSACFFYHSKNGPELSGVLRTKGRQREEVSFADASHVSKHLYQPHFMSVNRMGFLATWSHGKLVELDIMEGGHDARYSWDGNKVNRRLIDGRGAVVTGYDLTYFPPTIQVVGGRVETCKHIIQATDSHIRATADAFMHRLLWPILPAFQEGGGLF